MELKEKILNIIIDSDDRSLDYGVTATKILEQVEAGYISKEEHETIASELTARMEASNFAAKQLKEKLDRTEANSIPKDRVREKLGNLKAEQKRRYKTGSMNWLLVERKIEMLEELLGES